MTAADIDRQGPERAQLRVRSTTARLADSVEEVAFHAGHLGADLKSVARSKLARTKDEVKQTVAERTLHGIEVLTAKKQELSQRWADRAATPR